METDVYVALFLRHDLGVLERTEVPDRFSSDPFLVHDALKAGVSRKVLNSSRFWRPFSGVRVPCKLPDTLEVRCRALSLIMPTAAAFSHATAASLAKLPLPRDDQTSVEVNVPADHVVPKIIGVTGHTGLVPDDVVTVQGMRIVRPARTFFDLAPTLTLTDLIALGDAAVRHWCTTEELRDLAGQLSRRRGIVRARKAIEQVREGVDSRMETLVRLLIVSAGLPTPAVNVDVFDDAGGWIARPDLSFLDLKIAIEYDGDHHRTEKDQWRKDRGRDEAMRDAGWIVIVLTADDVFRHPNRTIGRIENAIVQRRG